MDLELYPPLFFSISTSVDEVVYLFVVFTFRLLVYSQINLHTNKHKNGKQANPYNKPSTVHKGHNTR